MNNKLKTLPGDFVERFLAEGPRMTFDGLAQKMARIVEIIAASRDGLKGTAPAAIAIEKARGQ